MDENLKDDIGTNSASSDTNRAIDDTNRVEEAAKKAALKKRRSWLGVKSSFSSGGHGEDYQPISYGEGHSGWNR